MLDEFEVFLRSRGQDHWADWIGRSNREIRNADFRGVSRLLRAYGGMGSLNDVVLPDDADDARLRKLASEVYELANDIRREYMGSG